MVESAGEGDLAGGAGGDGDVDPGLVVVGVVGDGLGRPRPCGSHRGPTAGAGGPVGARGAGHALRAGRARRTDWARRADRPGRAGVTLRARRAVGRALGPTGPWAPVSPLSPFGPAGPGGPPRPGSRARSASRPRGRGAGRARSRRRGRLMAFLAAAERLVVVIVPALDVLRLDRAVLDLRAGDLRRRVGAPAARENSDQRDRHAGLEPSDHVPSLQFGFPSRDAIRSCGLMLQSVAALTNGRSRRRGW